MISFDKLLHAKTQAIFGVSAQLIPSGGDILNIRAIDRTSGVEFTNGAGVASVLPAADLRRSDLVALGVTLEELDGGELHLNGDMWQIHFVLEHPTPFGAADGLVTLYLVGV